MDEGRKMIGKKISRGCDLRVGIGIISLATQELSIARTGHREMITYKKKGV